MTDIRAARSAYYNVKLVSRGAVHGFELRADEAGQLMFRGYASITDQPYKVWDWLGEYDETIVRGAFAKSLREQDDTRLLVNHEGVPIARTKSRTLTLTEITDPADDPQGRNQTGLWCEASLDPANPTVQEVMSAMKRGDLSEMSFAFMATRQEWNEDYTDRRVLEVKLLDVSIVTYPANPATSATLSDERSDERMVAKREQVLALLRSGNRLDEEQQAFVRAALEERDALIAVNITVTETETEIEHEEPDGDEVDEELSSDRSVDWLAELRLESARVDAVIR